ncbi:phosphatase PAP2 family protein [Ruminococcus sp.]|uniref:phosphatase PAP2 family protein n=1 Tax=Ruminococcus sp. TaxID=41978 RepID=UPI0025F29024|nr:phosphatase PAP2 family protein [Ruminococcus sp.]MBQ8966707.1 phosphatase PAP2 family protein [Ruminococcus sp.]
MIDKLLETDGQILLWIQENVRSDVLDPIVKAVTHMGDAGVIMIAAVLVLFIIPRTRRLGLLCGAALVINVLLNNVILKNAVDRTRPYEAINELHAMIGKQRDASFPSGHSSGSFCVASVIFRECRLRIGIPVLLLALSIALSRLYVGVHYPTDVLAGIITGTFYGIMTCVIYHKYISHEPSRLHR